MKKSKKGFILLALSFVLCMGLTMTSFAKAPAEEELAEIYSDVGFAMWCADEDRFEAGEQAPDEVVFWYMQLGGYLQDYFEQDTWNIVVDYDTYIQLVDENFANHSDMKAYLTEQGYYDAETNMITWFVGGFGSPIQWIPTTMSAYEGGNYTVTGLNVELLWEDEPNVDGLKEFYDYIMLDGDVWTINAVQQLDVVQVDGNLKVNGFKDVESYAMDGNYYTMGSDVVAHRLQFALDENVTFEGTVAGGLATRNTVTLRQLDGSDEYYLWPDSVSSLMFSVPEGVSIIEYALDPEDAGTMEQIVGIDIVNISLNKEATLIVKTDAPAVDPDPTPTPTPEEGWREDIRGIWYQNADGTYPYSTWKQIDGEWYYFDASGYRAHGWRQISGAWYFFDLDDGWMYGNDAYEINGVIYLFDESGALYTGWFEDIYEYEGETYSDWYYFTSSGMVTGWKQVGGTWYYFDLEAGWMYREAWAEIEGTEYYFDQSGAMVTGWYQESYPDDEGNTVYDWYYFDASGVMVTGWKQIGGTWYYFDENYGYMYSDCFEYIGGHEYIFDASGAMVTGWYHMTWEDENGEEWGDWYYAKSDGTLVTGWFKEGNTWYYFDDEYAYMYCNDVYEIDGKVYLFKESGAMATGWYFAGKFEWVDCQGNSRTINEYYYFASTGEAYDGWVYDSGSWYYIDEGYMMLLDVVEENGKLYFLQEDGRLANKPGWVYVVGTNNDAWIYVKNTSGELATGWQTIGGVKYYFDGPYGEMLSDGIYVIDGKYYNFDESGACLGEAELAS